MQLAEFRYEYTTSNPALEWRSGTVRSSRSESFLSELAD
jgi:hypothetical protein